MRALTQPVIVSGMGLETQACRALEPLALARGVGGGGYDEGWLQQLIHDHPAVLPIGAIEAGLSDAVSVCTELSVPSGFIDNLLVTADGGLVIVEAKLWRNPQARREVIGQVLDYAKDLKRWTYEDLDSAVRRARKDGASLLDAVLRVGPDEADAARFADAVSRNLRLGRFLCLIAGDGIQESAEQIADFVQQHVGLHFTLAMVELSLWRVPDTSDVLVQPRVVARTVQIERAVVRIDDGRGVIVSVAQPRASSERRIVSISQETFYEHIATTGPDLPARLAEYIADLQADGIRAEVKKTLSLKWLDPDGPDFFLGSVYRDGNVHFDWVNWEANGVGKLHLGHAYLQDVASILEGGFVHKTPKSTGWNVKTVRGWVTLAELLDRGTAWRAAMDRFIAAIRTP